MGIKRREGKSGKKVLKQARKIYDEVVVSFLESMEGTALSDLFFDNRDGIVGIHCWHPQNGEMELTIDDDAFALALKFYLERSGVPVITNRDELEDLARRNAWRNFRYESE